MQTRRFFLTAGLSFATVMTLGCTQQASNQAVSSPSPETPIAGSPSPVNTSTTAQTNQPTVLLSGTFVDGEHPTKGTVRILNQGGQRILELDQSFETSSMGPDLVVILHRSADVIGSTTPPAFPIKEGEYILLAPLKAFTGSQRYEIPASVNLADFKSAAIWCRKFNATFGAATLKS